ncbi:MAG TPA: hypothetical protein DCY35_10855 [Prolixibacteraceae bacterium]|nr:hypothetical protein [Prolixibacteraceae bacterium]
MTGCYPHTHGLMGLVHRGWALDVERCKPLPAILSKWGYSTNLFGFQHEHWDPYKLGYQNVYKAKSSHCEDLVPEFEKWLTSDRCSKPFFASIGFTEVHRMGLMPSNFRNKSYSPADPSKVEVRPYMPDISEIRNDLADFYGAVEYMDSWTGILLQAVEDSGIRNDTVVIFTTDHGASFIHSKATLYEGGTKVACIISWPGKLPMDKTVQGLTSHTDILPFLLNLLGIPLPGPVEGRDLSEIISDNSETLRKYVISEENYNNHFAPARAIRSARYRFIKYGINLCIFDFLIPEIELSSFDFRSNRDVFGFYPAKRVNEKLFDLYNDPGERNNLADDPKYCDVKQELESALVSHMRASGDPFLDLTITIRMQEKAYEDIQKLKTS